MTLDVNNGNGGSWYSKAGYSGDDRHFGDVTNYTDYSGDLSMSGTMTPSITDNIGVSDNISYSINGDSETRPSNYTVRVWKRIS